MKSRLNKKPKHKELEVEIKILWFKLRIKHLITR
ncbi:hypothetical protein SAG0055_04770 [Streptococcus agalactiae CCUG 29376]|uniref:Uncharacterized protein n=1 Tax=Streptococcus agalactiae CCUG 29376 TaxID=1105255 RepID=A0AAV3JHW8_STRAG|nr:hypothetical protein SAG0087_05905 [Streptococcus agalactiae LMG 15091]EPT92892.1 hypothetical protein SAG0105_00455 [Streptococcus agalactiae BSU96]EPT98240.1 hypothetical protein SAG0106_05705 [Streptococcus agalactiae BSU165]EPU07091.1 hypothetical protein SAG0110_11300 [Streptococcus agalactiae BSU167]EPU53181.1 hypothetical protein SAG0301_03180 [Streptococcus agalactiae GB00003]EPV30387.1 hypothetical protein SAG0336_10490 [Streptococcus agalactiae GB00653]EPW16432.1 hypothetical pro